MGVIAVHGSMAIRRMQDDVDDYARMVRWQNQPHVREWWDHDDPPMTIDRAIAAYRECTQPTASTTACIIEHARHPIGYCQFYSWADEKESASEIAFSPRPGWWGLDIFIGEHGSTGHGLGTQAVRLLVRYLAQDRQASTVALTTSVDNLRAIRAYEKAGFHRQGPVLDTDTKHGKRVESWLMVYQIS